MSDDILWTWNSGPLNQALHLASNLHGHTATLQVAFPPTADAQAALENAAAVEIGDAVLSTQTDGGPAARKLQRLLAEFDQIVAEAHAQEKRVQDLDRQEQAAANDESPSVAKRLLALARDREEAEAAAQDARAACEALNPLVQEARQAASRELAQAVKLRPAVAVSVIEIRRHEVHAEILRLLSPCLKLFEVSRRAAASTITMTGEDDQGNGKPRSSLKRISHNAFGAKTTNSPPRSGLVQRHPSPVGAARETLCREKQ